MFDGRKTYIRNGYGTMPVLWGVPMRFAGSGCLNLRRVGIYAHAVVLRSGCMPEHFQAAFGAERVGNECPPYLAESVLQKQKPK